MSYAGERKIIDADSHVIELDDFLSKAAHAADLDLIPPMADQTELQKVRLDLHQLNERKPGDPTTFLLLANVLALLGHRDEALSKVGGAYSLRKQLDRPRLNILAMVYAWLGEYERSREIYDGFVFEDEAKVSGNDLDNAARTAVLLGDLDYLTHVRDESQDAIEKGADTYLANEFLSAIEASEASKFYANQVVETIVPQPRTPTDLGLKPFAGDWAKWETDETSLGGSTKM